MTDPIIVSSPALWLAAEYRFGEGWLAIEDGRVAQAGTGAFPGTADVSPEGYIAPGFVDVHTHGGGGATFTEGADAARKAIATHREHGTTTMVASLVTATPDELIAQMAALAPLVAAGELAGVHLEGPWLCAAHKGAHDPAKLAAPALAQ
ncbi:MAG: amidohydrolase family protein, partial [Propionibacteriaceae bacterium]|nr:amidohydrolase family protein [Propionibacteriaceae bacterium]